MSDSRQNVHYESSKVEMLLFAAMPSPVAALSFGYDPLLLETRRGVIARAEVEVVDVVTLAAFETALHGRHFDLLLLCHSLSTTDCSAASDLSASCVPEAKLLLLRSGYTSRCSLTQAEHFDVNRGPAELIARIRSLTHLATAKQSPTEIEMPQYDGQVRWFNNAEGYGFVSGEDGGKDVVSHVHGVQGDGYKPLAEGDQGVLDGVDSAKGPQAVDVHPQKKP